MTFRPHRFCLLLCAIVIAAAPLVSHAFVFHGYRWPQGTDILMHLHAGAPAMPLQDGSASWDDSAADALRVWNEHLGSVRFRQAGAITPSGGDRNNSVFFSDTIYGEAFGSSVLAVTIQYNPQGYTFTETDVIFNSRVRWDSYRGPVQRATGTIYDFHRVALHEFGHVLGLDHPDQKGQPAAVALMRSVIGDLDHLTEDDIDGVIYLYGGRITSSLSPLRVPAGTRFSYQITANNKPTSFAAGPLPEGVKLNASTGVISGIASFVGEFNVNLTAFSTFSSGSAKLQIVIIPSQITSTFVPPVAQAGLAFSYRVTAANEPSHYSAEGLPAGLSIDPATGIIAGIPSVTGTFEVTVRAHGPSGDASAVITIQLVEPRITSHLQPPPLQLGDSVRYQLTTTNATTFFSATGLPSGLTMDPKTGVISGIATLSGAFDIRVTSHGIIDASAVLRLTVYAVPDRPMTSVAITAGHMVVDHARARLYVTDARAIVVVDTKTLSVIGRIPAQDFVRGLTISPDGMKLWAANFAPGHLVPIDLETLTPGAGSQVQTWLGEVRAGLGGRMYIVASGGGVHQLDLATGQMLTFSPAPSGSAAIEISPDRRSLYVITTTETPATLARYDISGPVPRLIQKTTQGANQARGMSVSVSNQGQYVCFVTSNSLDGQPPTPIRSTSNLDEVVGWVNPARASASGVPVVFSADDSLLFQAVSGGSIDVFETKGFTRVRTIIVGNNAVLGRMAVDPTSSYLFVSAGGGSSLPVYQIRPQISPPPAAPPASLLNVSTRLRSDTGENALIAGFIVAGTSPKKVLLRAIGSSLPLNGKMADPRVELFNASGESVAFNDNWNFSRAEVLATGAAPAHEREAALVITLPPGSYTAVVNGPESGIAVAELYDLSPDTSKVANISTRGRVETGDDVMIGGFIIGGDQPTRVIVRAIGPSLRDSGVAGALEDTTLNLHDGNGALLASNDDWRTDQQDAIAGTSIPPNNDLESAIVATLDPGDYTAIIRGKDGTTGVALVEVYNLETN